MLIRFLLSDAKTTLDDNFLSGEHMKYQDVLRKILLGDPTRMKALYAVRALKLSDGWIGAGFVRDAVWDYLHGYGQMPVSGDVDVVWFNSERCKPAHDSYLEGRLSQQLPEFKIKPECINVMAMHLISQQKMLFYTGQKLLLLSLSDWEIKILSRLMRPMDLMTCLNCVCNQRQHLRVKSLMFLSNVSLQKVGWNVIPCCSLPFPYNRSQQIILLFFAA